MSTFIVISNDHRWTMDENLNNALIEIFKTTSNEATELMVREIQCDPKHVQVTETGGILHPVGTKAIEHRNVILTNEQVFEAKAIAAAYDSLCASMADLADQITQEAIKAAIEDGKE